MRNSARIVISDKINLCCLPDSGKIDCNVIYCKFFTMTICNGTTKAGNKCRATAGDNGYCRWHSADAQDCGVCYEPCKDEGALPCGHWVHRECVQKGADAMQEIRAADGYPPIDECYCPICKASVPGMKPIEAPPVPSLLTAATLTTGELREAFQAWEESDRAAPISWYIWVLLSEKYPQYNDDQELVILSTMFEHLIRIGFIDPRPPQLDQRFAEVLNREW